MNNDNTVTVDSLKALYLKLRDKIMHKDELTNDIGPIFIKGIREKLIKGEQLKIVIKGQTTKGKSTTGIAIKYMINKEIQQLNKEGKLKQTSTYTGEEQEYELIASNQIEFMRIARRDDLQQVCCQIDEFSDMAQSGANATTEQKMLEWYDKVCAQKYLHLIYCTPENDYDKYGIIILEVLDVDKNKGITKLEVYYNNPTDIKTVFLGYLTINVNHILQKPWYQKYKARKQYAMDLMLKESVKDVRELEFALVSLIGYQRCKELAELGIKDPDIINIKLDKIIRETKSVYSLVSQNLVTTRIKGLLSPIIARRNAYIQINKRRKTPLNMVEIAELKRQIEIFEKELQESYNSQLELVKLYLQYAKLGSEKYHEDLTKILKKDNIKVTA